MSDDEEELAQLRAARAARLGLPAGGGRAGGGGGGGGSGGGGTRPYGDDGDGGDGEEDEQRARAVASLPMSFGKGSAAAAGGGGQRAAPPARATYGPMRPPPPRAAPAPKPAAAADDNDDDDGDGAYGPPRPPPSPPRAKAAAAAAAAGQEAEEEEQAYGPPRPPPDSRRRGRSRGDDDDDDDSDSDNDNDDGDPYDLPVSQEASFGIGEGGDKPGARPARAVLAVAADPQGSRLAAGGSDRVARLYDFGAMRADLRPFRELRPGEDAHPVLALSWAPQGAALLVVSAAPTARLYDRDGRPLAETARGDMYVRDARHTKGHSAALTGGCWHPADRGVFLTSSEDGTLRLWDASSAAQRTVVKPAVAAAAGGGGRVRATCCAFSPGSGALIAGGLSDGSVQLWTGPQAGAGGRMGQAATTGVVAGPVTKMLGKQDWSHVAPGTGGHRVVRGAHEPGVEVTCVAFAPAGGGASAGGGGPAAVFASRSLDGFVRLWDARKLSSSSSASVAPVRAGAGASGSSKNPALLAEVGGLWADSPVASVAFSPNGRLLVAGCAGGGGGGGGGAGAGGAGGGGGQLVFIDISGALPAGSAAARPSAATAGATGTGAGGTGGKPAAAAAVVVRRLGVPGCADVAGVLWHPRLNQIFFGCGDARSGSARVLFDPRRSTRGALPCVGRAPRRPAADDFVLPSLVIAPAAERRGKKAPRGAAENGGGGGGGGANFSAGSGAPSRPAMAPAGAPLHAVGTVAAAASGRGGTMLTSMMAGRAGAAAAAAAAAAGGGEDVRAAMLRHAGRQDDSIGRLTSAYAKTQPKPIFAEEDDDEEEEAKGRR